MPRPKNNTVDLRGTNKEASLYKYRDEGCNFADWAWGIPNRESRCEWCLMADTLILNANMLWIPMVELSKGDIVFAFPEQAILGQRRRFEQAIVTKTFRHQAECYLIECTTGSVIATKDHRWLTRKGKWAHLGNLRRGSLLRSIGNAILRPQENEDYKLGYLTGITVGDGSFKYKPEQPYGDNYWRLALTDIESLTRVQAYLETFWIFLELKPYTVNHLGANSMWQLRTRKLDWNNRLFHLLNEERDTESYKRGYLAGIFDAEGSLNRSNLRIGLKNEEALRRIIDYGYYLDLKFAREPYQTSVPEVRLFGGIADRIKFFAVANPVARKKKLALLGMEFRTSDYSEVIKIEPVGIQWVYNLETTSNTFFANGLASHNCPFGECIKEAEVSLKDLYLHWPDLVVWLRRHRNLTYVQLGALFRLHPASVEKILNGNKEVKDE